MRTLVARIVIAVLVALAVVVTGGLPTFASSNLSTGTSRTQDPINRRDTGLAVCALFLGPMDGIPDGEFLLEIGDINTPNADDRLELRGTVIRQPDGSNRLATDDAAADDFYEQILRTKLHRPASDVNLQRLLVTVGQQEGDIGPTTITCSIQMTGALVGSAGAGGRVGFDYAGPGTVFQGPQPVPATDGARADAASCPQPNFAPAPEDCDTPDCLVTFAGYKWWTEYHWNENEGFYNGGLKTIFSPRNVSVDAEGLHLFVREQDIPDRKWAGGEAVVVLNGDGSPAKLGYGTYLVAARAKTSSWDVLDPNVSFGAFTYQREASSDKANPNREIDLAEISRWGVPPGGVCTLKDTPLCDGNAQFALQQWWKGGSTLPNVRRYTIGAGVKELTLVMVWQGGRKPVTFRQYNGLHTLATLPAQPDHEWITASDRNPYVPEDGCQQFHLNLWMGNFAGTVNGLNPPPAAPQEIVVTHFEYKPQ